MLKVGISSSSIGHRGIQAHFSSEAVFWWDVDYLQSMPK